MNQPTYTTEIAACFLPNLEARVATANRHATKYGLEPVVLVASEPHVATDDDGSKYEVITVTLSGGRHHDGWTFTAIVDRSETAPFIVSTVGTDAPDPAWAYLPDYCDHCATANRGRKTIIVVTHDDGRVRKVGKACVKDYLGRSLASFTLFHDLVDDTDEWGWTAGRGEWVEDTTWFLAGTSAAMRDHGWVPRSSRDDMPTANRVIEWSKAGQRDEREAATKWIAEVSDADRTLAANALAWVTNIADDEPSEYLRNIGIIARRGYVTQRTAGYAASIIGAYQRAEAKRLELADVPPATPIPVSTDRLTITGTVLMTKWVSNDYGSTEKMRVRDDRGFVVWGTVPRSIEDVESGDRVTFAARVTPSETDPTFGFFRGPSRATIIAE